MPEQYEVVIAQYGTRQGHRAEVYLNYHIYGQPDGPIGMDYFVWVIRNDERTILVDTGFSRAGGANRKRTFVKDPSEIYAALGIDTEAEQTIVVTHAHYDHIGNLAMFPKGEIVIAQAEYDFWTSGLGERAQFRWSTEDEEIEQLRLAHAEGRVRTFTGSLELAPGVELIELGGHTPGQSAVRVATSEGDVLLASDAVHYYEELDDDLPFAFVADLPKMYAGFDRVRELMADGVAHVVPGHDPATLDRFRRIDDGPLAGIAATIGTSDRTGA
ncbi:N-acyl homoserine lactonase family protein [Agromyces aerolatus]|uniref:N-acyl homoserine lactonase family protein n=1 Tax=Agromyces sp. LY-1074 TaxID=3074080 RepID=UPI00285C7BFE|nr:MULTISPECIES: N-acyl homoserine lactonase family protein [unclassified Agromyces]MDR5698704.1 N-acyl homoserine lactonase family protein [Agromyces sp. LY-1074]MDR5704998.1 N-acyl homoserine lactonase family protein [Agromyces sp. LY-1358]